MKVDRTTSAAHNPTTPTITGKARSRAWGKKRQKFKVSLMRYGYNGMVNFRNTPTKIGTARKWTRYADCDMTLPLQKRRKKKRQFAYRKPASSQASEL
eukprot:695385-Rhodomonas_salina.4